jgi:thiol-disulfide isomerase/thioredoxin
MMGESSDEAVMESGSESGMAMPAAPTPEEVLSQPAEDALMAAPEWFSVELTNVNTGETFTINDLKGKVVLVETMAQWCSNCLKQQMQVKELHALLGADVDLVSIALDIDPNEDDATLKDYALNHGFDWVYAVAPAEVSREIGNLYTAQFLNPPSTPILIVDRSGEAHPLPFGIKSADDLKQAIEPFLNEGM